jgi:hypothetical protein
VIKRKMNRRHMIGDHHGWGATLLVRAMDAHDSCSASVLALAA